MMSCVISGCEEKENGEVAGEILQRQQIMICKSFPKGHSKN